MVTKTYYFKTFGKWVWGMTSKIQHYLRMEGKTLSFVFKLRYTSIVQSVGRLRRPCGQFHQLHDTWAHFINILRTAFTLVDPESIKNTVKSPVSFYAFEI